MTAIAMLNGTYYSISLKNLSLFIIWLAGQQRSRMLATLFKDERCQQLPAYSILEKMYLDRIIRRSELHEFEALMQTHQKATCHIYHSVQAK